MVMGCVSVPFSLRMSLAPVSYVISASSHQVFSHILDVSCHIPCPYSYVIGGGPSQMAFATASSLFLSFVRVQNTLVVIFSGLERAPQDRYTPIMNALYQNIIP